MYIRAKSWTWLSCILCEGSKQQAVDFWRNGGKTATKVFYSGLITDFLYLCCIPQAQSLCPFQNLSLIVLILFNWKRWEFLVEENNPKYNHKMGIFFLRQFLFQKRWSLFLSWAARNLPLHERKLQLPLKCHKCHGLLAVQNHCYVLSKHVQAENK